MAHLIAISKLQTALNQATAEANADASTNDSADESLASLQKAILNLEKVRLRFNALELDLDAKDKTVAASTDNYFDAIEAVRTALDTGGELSDEAETNAAEALKTGLVLDTVAELDPLLAVVTGYDIKTDTDLNTAQGDLDTALITLAAAEKECDKKKAGLEAISNAIIALAANAKKASSAAKEDLNAVNKAIDDKRFQEAVVYLQGLKSLRSTLKDIIDKTFAVLNFDADGTKADLETKLTEAWNDAKTDYESAVADYIEKETTAFSKRLGLIEAEGKANTRTARRLIDAAQPVESPGEGE